jgi:hypothetical protein
MRGVVFSHTPLKVAGFGACMISGYPHDSGGFFDIACTRIAEDLTCSLESKIVSLGGFPAPRAEKYLALKVMGDAPNYVIIQFAAYDAACHVRQRRLSTSSSGTGGSGAENRARLARSATRLSRLRWELASVWSYFQRPSPITPLSAYIPVMERMIDSCIAAGATPVVLTPFIYGSRYSTRNGVAYATALQEVLSRKSDGVLVDCIEALRAYPAHTVLQRDGFHLSPKGHAIVGLAVAQRVMSHLRRREQTSAVNPEPDPAMRRVPVLDT